jgi:uncharacterized protein YdeI (YjbR/CyaY-like superfamily)
LAAKPDSPKVTPRVLTVVSSGEWEAWLEDNHVSTTEGVWLRLFNKGSGQVALTYVEAVEIALCFGWIDGQARRHDEISRVQRFTPRRARSMWSKINTDRAERLIAADRMRPAGFAEIERAKRDGRWDQAYDPPSTATIPEDFAAALQKSAKAAKFFAILDKRNTYSIVHRLQTAKTAQTRAKRIQAIIEMLERGEKFHD